MSQFASADQEFWDDYAYNQWNPKFQGMGEPVDVIRLLTHAATANISNIINGIFNGWFGGGGVGDPQQVQYTIEAIADAVINGYTVETKVTSGTWAKPANITELVVICIGGGQNGQNGQLTSVSAGGKGGGYIAQQVDPATLAASTPYVVGTSGNPSSFGTHVVTVPDVGSMSSAFGYTETTSLPGAGGAGGSGAGGSNAPATAGTAGQPTPVAAGGAPGQPTSGIGGPGSAGGNANPAATTKCGGAGGGGGGGGSVQFVNAGTGGPGGPGGYPGGGGGGGGGRASGVGFGVEGAGGIGATGIIWLFWR